MDRVAASNLRGIDTPKRHRLRQHGASPAMRLTFSAKHTKCHSPRTFCTPRRLNRRNPSTSLIQPFGPSDIHLRLAYCARPVSLASFSPMRWVAELGKRPGVIAYCGTRIGNLQEGRGG